MTKIDEYKNKMNWDIWEDVMTDNQIDTINGRIGNAFQAYENCKETSAWGRNYWEGVIKNLLRKYNRMN